ncbi:MAG: di-heme-cytochrome C peroxidase [Candidatus Acidiferrales bacterium]
MKKLILVAAVVILIILIVYGAKYFHDNFTVELPEYPPIGKVVWLEQNWTAEQRDWFHHADQGTQTFGIPCEWFIALEQPSLSLGAPGLLSDPAYLDRYGFIPDNVHPDKPELPIGFAHGGLVLDASGSPLRNPQTNAQMTSLGLTCAACHTGRFTYKDTTFLVDGGPALTNVQNFQKAVGLSIVYTHVLPGRFARFADRVLGPGASDDAKSNLRKQFDPVYSQVREVANLEKSVKAHSVNEGFARLDALSRIGNTVFALDLDHHENFVAYSAPVHFPRIWNASWFEWVQYNGSIQRPMTRNAGEALGVRATVNFPVAKDQLPTSSVQVDTLFKLEQLLAGDKPPNPKDGFAGLASPKWNDTKILPPIDTTLAAKGAILYKSHCQRCHLPTTSDPEFWIAPQWSPVNAAGERYLDLNMIDIAHVGTDPAEAEDMKNRTVSVPPSIGITNNSGQVITTDDFGNTLRQLVTAVVNRWYDSQVPPTPPALREKMNGFRPDGIRATLQYKARPLNGIWATPPYLHNGSVPNLYALLSPVAERPKCFYLGNREYDPVNVGYSTHELPGGFELDTRIRGNNNTGHEFNTGTGKGIIGPLLTPDERRALIEFLKTL